MLKKPCLILACIILGFIGTSQGFSIVDFFTNLIPSIGSALDSSSNPDLPLDLCPVKSKTQCNPGSGDVFENVPEVKKFINTFLEAVYKSDTLRDAFDLSETTPQQNADFVKQYTEKVLLGIGVDKRIASTIGKFAAQAIPQLDSLTLPIVSRAYANMAAKFLFVDGDLEASNAEDLAMSLAKSMDARAKAIMNSDPISKFLALADGFVSFFVSNGEFTPTKAPSLGVFVGYQWVITANNPCL